MFLLSISEILGSNTFLRRQETGVQGGRVYATTNKYPDFLRAAWF